MTRLLKVKPGGTVVLAFIVFMPRAPRDRVNARGMKEMAQHQPPADIPFDMKRMAYGGFQTIVGK